MTRRFNMKKAFRILVGGAFILMMCHSFIYLIRIAEEQGLVDAFIPMLMLSVTFIVFGFIIREMMR
jgi:hypothetical protein